MSELIYNPLEDSDINIPTFKRDGKNLILPAFISGFKTKEVTAKRTGDSLTLVELEFEVHDSAEKINNITIFHEDEDGVYIYDKPDREVSGATFVGSRVKGGRRTNLWRNNTSGSSKQNRILIQTLESIGVVLEKKEIEHDGKKLTVPVIPDLNEDTLLGLPVFIWMDEESFTNNQGYLVRFQRVGKMVKLDGVERVSVLENSMEEKAKTKADSDDPFSADSDIDDFPF